MGFEFVVRQMTVCVRVGRVEVRHVCLALILVCAHVVQGHFVIVAEKWHQEK